MPGAAGEFLVLPRGSPVTQPTQSFSSAGPPALAKGTFCLIAFEGVKEEEAQALWSLAVPAGAEAPRILLEESAHKPHGWRGERALPSAQSWSGKVWTSSTRT